MKSKLHKAKEMVAKGDVKGALDLLKSLSEDIKGYVSRCPGCGGDMAVVQKSGAERGECPKCGALFVKKHISSQMIKCGTGDSMNKKEIIAKLWDLYRTNDADADAFSINEFDRTGWLKKSLVEKLGLPVPAESLKKSEEETKKSDDSGRLTKDTILDIMLQMIQKGEQPSLINRHSLSKFEATGHIEERVLKTVYIKAGKDFDALHKQEVSKTVLDSKDPNGDCPESLDKKTDDSSPRGKDSVPADLEDKEEMKDSHTGALKPKIEKAVDPELEAAARKRFSAKLVADGHLEQAHADSMPLSELRDLHDEKVPTVISHVRTGGAKGTGTETKRYQQVLNGKKK